MSKKKRNPLWRKVNSGPTRDTYEHVVFGSAVVIHARPDKLSELGSHLRVNSTNLSRTVKSDAFTHLSRRAETTNMLNEIKRRLRHTKK